MMFCKCGKLMSETDFGFECICGRKIDANGNEISDKDAENMLTEAQRTAAVKAKYHSKYPNMSDPVVRVTSPAEESEFEDETFSSVRPSERKREKKGKFFH